MKGRENKPHIGIFGRRNNGKSSFINSLAGQDIAIVSDTPGTTTDPVKKSIELPGIGPAILIDTAGMDDTGELGKLRVAKTHGILPNIDLAILVIAENQLEEPEKKMVEEFKKFDLPFFIVHNKSDIEEISPETKEIARGLKAEIVPYSALKNPDTSLIVEAINRNMPKTAWQRPSLLGSLVKYGDVVLLITPIDIEAPEGRLILPQVQAIRDILDNDCIAIICKEREAGTFLRQSGIRPKLVITDSQAFLKADAIVPKDIPLTGFSVLLARYKGDFENYLKGTPKISELKDSDRILMLESCTHHTSCDDIGRVKIPRWISQFTGKNLEFDMVTGLSNLPRPITDYALVVQCGGCMITRRQLINRLKPAIDAGVPVTNYGMAIAYVQGIYNRAVAPFVEGKGSGEDYL
jgi:[FeFe] hydrogenase H-cluster maturation GTPase HydF